MRNTTPITASAFAAGLLFTGTAIAGVAASPTFPVNVQTSQLDGYDFEFVIHNCVENAEITGIYFEDGWDTFFSDDLFDRNLRIDSGPLNFLEGTVTPALDPWTTSTVSYETPEGLDGLLTGGVATIAFVNNGVADLTAEQIEEAINTAGFGIGLQIAGINEGPVFQFAIPGLHENCELDDDGGEGIEDGDDEGDGDGGIEDGGAVGVPSPSAALMGLALIGMMGQRRRRDA
ncbi:MAG: hypothetical protein ACIAXF_14005 [Phycisphaerales bacterium JB063]